MASWWASKVRQFRSHVRARVAPDERAALAGWVTADQVALFDSMHIADRRHGLDVVTTLREQGVTDEEVLLAGLLHDAGKGRTGVWPRVAYSLGQAYGPWVWRVAGVLPPMRAALERLREHAETSARLAERAGASPRTVDLIRHQEAPVDPDAGRLLQLADEAN
jgi:HD domain-containing protein